MDSDNVAAFGVQCRLHYQISMPARIQSKKLVLSSDQPRSAARCPLCKGSRHAVNKLFWIRWMNVRG